LFKTDAFETPLLRGCALVAAASIGKICLLPCMIELLWKRPSRPVNVIVVNRSTLPHRRRSVFVYFLDAIARTGTAIKQDGPRSRFCLGIRGQACRRNALRVETPD